MHETYIKELKLLSMKGQRGKVILKYNKLFKRFTIKVYFQGKKISKDSFSIKKEEDLQLLLAFKNEKIVYFTEWEKASGLGGFYKAFTGYGENREESTIDFSNSYFHGYYDYKTNEKITKILTRNKLKNA